MTTYKIYVPVSQIVCGTIAVSIEAESIEEAMRIAHEETIEVIRHSNIDIEDYCEVELTVTDDFFNDPDMFHVDEDN